MTKRAPDTPSDGRASDVTALDREESWNQVIAGLEDKQDILALEATRVQLAKQQEAVSVLLEELAEREQQAADGRAVLLEGALALRKASAESDERVTVLAKQKAELQGKLDKAELSLVVVREEVSALEERLEAIRKEHKRLEGEGKAREQRVREADDKVAKANAARKMAADQLDEALETLTEMGLTKAETERKIADLEGGFEAVKEERAAAEERWSAADDGRIKQIRELKSRVEHLESKVETAEKERDALATTEQQEREALEQAWKEATAQREALASVRAEAKEKIEVLERQQEEFIANLVDDYDEQMAEAKKELEELRVKGVDDASIKQAQLERDEAREALAAVRLELEAAQRGATKVAELEEELETLRTSGGELAAEDREQLRQDLERAKSELEEARAGVDQLLTDCDRLNAENVRLTQAVKEAEQARPSISLELDATEGTPDAVGMLEARASSPQFGGPQRAGEPASESQASGKLQALQSDLDEARAELERLKAEHQRELEKAMESAGRGHSSKKKSQAKRSTRAATRKAKASSSDSQPQSKPSEPPSPSSHPDASSEEPEEGSRRAGSYSLIGGEFATETVAGKKKRGSD